MATPKERVQAGHEREHQHLYGVTEDVESLVVCYKRGTCEAD